MKKEKLYQKFEYLQSKQLQLYIIISKILEIGYEEFEIPDQLMEDIVSANNEIYDNIMYIEKSLICLHDITEFKGLIYECINTSEVVIAVLELLGIIIDNFWFLKGDSYLLFIFLKI